VEHDTGTATNITAALFIHTGRALTTIIITRLRRWLFIMPSFYAHVCVPTTLDNGMGNGSFRFIAGMALTGTHRFHWRKY